jgi:hypothetical protein
MLFFDDEARNRNVEKELGVYMQLVKTGVTVKAVDAAVKEWRHRREFRERFFPAKKRKTDDEDKADAEE